MLSSASHEIVERPLFYDFNTLVNIGKTITAGKSFEITIRELLHLILDSTSISGGAILLYKQSSVRLQISSAHGIDLNQDSFILPSDVAGLLASNPLPIVLAKPIDWLAPYIEQNKSCLNLLQAQVWIPLVVANSLIGILSLGSKLNNFIYSDEDFKFLTIVANHTSIAIYNHEVLNDARKANFKLNHKVLEMESLYNVGLSIGSKLNLDELAKEILLRSVMLLDANRGALLWVEDDLLRLASSFGIEENLLSKFVLHLNKLPIKLRNAILEKKQSCVLNEHDFVDIFRVNSLLAVPILIGQDVVGILIIFDKEARDGSFRSFSVDDEKFLSAISNQAAIAIDNARLHKEALEKERFEKELEVAAAIQKRLLPEGPPRIDGIELIGVNLPCRQVGGDYYNYIPLDNKRLGIVIADVSGKGTPAALLVSTLQASFSALLENYDLSEVVTRLNKVIFKASPSHDYITFFYGILDLEEKIFYSINAGHNYPLLLRKNGEWQKLSTGGFCLGMFEDVTYEIEKTQLQSGDLLFLYTDGVTESANPAQEEFEEERVMEIFKNHASHSLQEISSNLSSSIGSFIGKEPQHDDLTYVLLRLK